MEKQLFVDDDNIAYESIMDTYDKNENNKFDQEKVELEDPGETMELKENEDDLTSTVVSTIQENKTGLLTSEKYKYGSIYSTTNSPQKKVMNSEVFFDELVNEDVDLNEIPIEDEEEEICSLTETKVYSVQLDEEKDAKCDIITSTDQIYWHDTMYKKPVKYVASKIKKRVTRRDEFQELTERKIWSRYIDGEPVINNDEIQDYNEEYWYFMSLSYSDSSRESNSTYDSLFEDIDKMIKHEQKYGKSKRKRESTRLQEKYGYYENTDNVRESSDNWSKLNLVNNFQYWINWQKIKYWTELSRSWNRGWWGIPGIC